MPTSTPITQTILGALRDLRHAIERAWTYPDLARDGLPPVLDAAGSHLIPALKRHHNNENAEVLALALSCSNVEGSISRESLTALLDTIDRLLICLPLGNHLLKHHGGMPLKEAEPKIRAYSKQLPEEETTPSLEVDLERGYLKYGSQTIRTGSKFALKILSILNNHRNFPCSPQKLMDLVWAERIVTEDAVSKQVGQARKLLANVTRDLEIVQRRGYGWELIGVSSDG